MFTPKRPEATCLIFERRSSRKRAGSSPPSPVFERPPMRFIATASVSCASRESEPSDIAPVEKRLTISAAGSTSSSGIGACSATEAQQPAQRRAARGVAVDRVARTARTSPSRRARTACCSSAIVSGFHWWCSPSRAPRVEPDDRQQLVVGAGVGARVTRERVPRRARRSPIAADARRRAGEVALDELGREPDRLEDLRAAVRRDRRDAHLRDRLQQPLADRLQRARSRLLARQSRAGRRSTSSPSVASIRYGLTAAAP